MNIGIVTWYTGSNYGTNLQAIALQWFLRKIGHNVSLISYNEEMTRWTEKRTFQMRIMNQPVKYASRIAYRRFKSEIAERDISLRESILNNCCFTEKANTPEEFIKICNQFELLIVGSDQVWNPRWYAPLYYFDFDGIKTKRISYAPSIGLNTIPKEKQSAIQKSLSKFCAVSVREASGANLIKELSPVSPVVAVDPTLLLSAEEWNTVFPETRTHKMSNFVLSVFLTDNLNHWHAAKRFAKEKHLQLVIIPYQGFSYMKKGVICADADLAKLLCLIRNATYIITDSFHVSVFSIIYGKQFIPIERFKEDTTTSTNERIRNLLSIANIEERLQVYNCRKIPDMPKVKYDVVRRAINVEIERSKRFLINAIGEEHN